MRTKDADRFGKLGSRGERVRLGDVDDSNWHSISARLTLDD